MASRDHPLRVLHVGPAPDWGQGGGVDVAAWPLLSAQVVEGLDVSLLMLREADTTACAEATRVGVNLAEVPAQLFETLSREAVPVVRRILPDLVHFHSVFIPAHAQLARTLGKLQIPYAVSPHGGLNLWRGRVKKAIYGELVEKPYFRKAGIIFVLTDRERQTIEDWVSGGGNPARCVELPNPIQALPAATALWSQPSSLSLIYLGRFDVVKKGLDRLVQIARLLPSVDVRAYGTASRQEQRGFMRMCRLGLPDNMKFLGPVHSEEKTAALTSATMYIQPSRDEGFGMAIVEAMRLAVPTVVTAGCALSDTIAKKDLGLVISDDPSVAAAQLKAALEDPIRLAHWSEAGKQWTTDVLSPRRLAQHTIAAYRSVLSDN
jgi:glycosyltransferase involved in cell wall biosynthesis